MGLFSFFAKNKAKQPTEVVPDKNFIFIERDLTPEEALKFDAPKLKVNVLNQAVAGLLSDDAKNKLERLVHQEFTTAFGFQSKRTKDNQASTIRLSKEALPKTLGIMIEKESLTFHFREDVGRGAIVNEQGELVIVSKDKKAGNEITSVGFKHPDHLNEPEYRQKLIAELQQHIKALEPKELTLMRIIAASSDLHKLRAVKAALEKNVI